MTTETTDVRALYRAPLDVGGTRGTSTVLMWYASISTTQKRGTRRSAKGNTRGARRKKGSRVRGAFPPPLGGGNVPPQISSKLSKTASYPSHGDPPRTPTWVRSATSGAGHQDRPAGPGGAAPPRPVSSVLSGHRKGGRRTYAGVAGPYRAGRAGRRARRTCHHHPHSERRDGDHHSEGAVHAAP